MKNQHLAATTLAFDTRWLFLLCPLLIPVLGTAAPESPRLMAAHTQVVRLPSGDLADVHAPIVSPRLNRYFEDAFPLVILLQGARVDKSRYAQFGQRLAARGYVVVIPNHEQVIPGFGLALFTEVGVVSHVLDRMRLADEDPSSRLFQIVDTERLGLVGHSFGGGIAINAAAGICERPFACQDSFERPDALKAIVVYGGNRPDFEGDTSGVAVALLQGTLDGVADPEKAEQTLPLLQPPHALIHVTGANHYGICNEDDPEADASTPTLDQQRGLDQIVGWTSLWLESHLTPSPGQH
ncbi:alpha/beta hydrolase family protein [Thiocystis violacea]|uniref:alpha/beta hydrolase family protein n=1 Tax=Thiocystis violacea TaxID=13725 RepID=UPI00190693E4|nr:alpha/beta hydrolase [Thiocystis violacea]MBK1719620.1 hypothetical protein [Thiocystis violacea]